MPVNVISALLSWKITWTLNRLCECTGWSALMLVGTDFPVMCLGFLNPKQINKPLPVIIVKNRDNDQTAQMRRPIRVYYLFMYLYS